MTRDEVMAMSKEQLRAEIAKELGWILDKNSLSWVGSFVVNKGSPSDNIPDEYECSVIPDWPNDISAAFELVEDARNHGYQFDLTIGDKEDGKDCVIAMFCAPGDEEHPIVAEAETAPLAISRAWLIRKKESEK